MHDLSPSINASSHCIRVDSLTCRETWWMRTSHSYYRHRWNCHIWPSESIYHFWSHPPKLNDFRHTFSHIATIFGPAKTSITFGHITPNRVTEFRFLSHFLLCCDHIWPSKNIHYLWSHPLNGISEFQFFGTFSAMVWLSQDYLFESVGGNWSSLQKPITSHWQLSQMSRPGFEPGQWWESASSQWQCLRPLSH